MERKNWVMLGGFVGTILTIIVVFFAGLQTMNSRFVAIENRLLSVDEHLRGPDASLDDAHRSIRSQYRSLILLIKTVDKEAKNDHNIP